MNKTKILSNILLGVIITVWLVVGIHFMLTQPLGVVYNCSIAEISPDFPVKVREECRKLRMENIK